jgi:RHS repeat-associated protein
MKGMQMSPAALCDDFGRNVILMLHDHGKKIARYDVADRLLEVIDAAGGTTEFAYDAAGRLTRKSARLSHGAVADTAAFFYEGARLARVEDPAQTTTYHYDESGRVTETSFTLKDAHGRDVSTYTTATTYDERTGQPATQTLADGEVLRIERDPTNLIARRMELQSSWADWLSSMIARHFPAWMQWLQRAVPHSTVVQDIRFHPFNGIEGFTSGNGIPTAKSFDIAGRLTRLEVGAPKETLYDAKYGYAVGPKIRDIGVNNVQGPLSNATYRYDGFGALRSDSTASAGKLLRTSFPANGTPEIHAQRDELGRTRDDNRYRYTYTVEGQVESVSDKSGRQLATYRYNSFSQRVSKTVFAPNAQGVTTYFLWQRDKLVAETDAKGHITSQYIYLGEDGKAAPVAKLESSDNPDNASRAERILYIHADHRGTPIAMTDSARKVVWTARVSPWGAANVNASAGATLNLRFPGQYFDLETGLHDNFHRTYDPQLGAYLQPDPLGYPDGPNAYAYASGDPVNKFDSLGLYEEDVHYYLTFFLARVAGIPDDTARTIALADQFVDDNPLTTPVIGSMQPNTRALPLYHFTRTRDMDVTQDVVTRINNPTSPQLENLRRPTMDDRLTPCARQQFFGEYLHAFEDTFAHRDQNNVPFYFTSTVGHGAYNHDPDQTYNVRDFQNNEMRTMRMAQEVFGQLQSFGGGASTHSWSEIQSTVLEFVRTGQQAGNAAPRWQDTCTPFNTCDKQAYAERKTAELDAKASVLESKLISFGLLSTGDLLPNTGRLDYNETEAERQRTENLKGLTHAVDPQTNQPAFQGILLPGD